MNNKVLISVDNLKKYYPLKKKNIVGKKEYIKAVDGVSFEIIEGETLGVVGESGCGKSTLGRSIIQLEEITSGSVSFEDVNINEASKKEVESIRKDIQMIFQDPYASLNPRQKIGNAIAEPMVIHGRHSKKERKEKVENLLTEVGLKPEHYNRFPHEFSGGQRQRIGIARALALNPKFIVCDEPVSALDVSVQAQIIKILQDLQEKHKLTYLFISHDLGVVRYICDRVLVMYLGHMAELAPTDKLYTNPQHPYTKILLSAIPRINLNRKKERIKINEISNENMEENKGCIFAPRCPIATERCWKEIPKWRAIDDNHYVACHEV